MRNTITIRRGAHPTIEQHNRRIISDEMTLEYPKQTTGRIGLCDLEECGQPHVQNHRVHIDDNSLIQ